MTTKKTSRRALLTSVMALVMCLVMLVGTTFAWFTDSVTSGVNTIKSGNLDMEVTYKTAKGGEQATGTLTKDIKLFDDGALWEPGHVEYAVLTVKNAGSLALKYKLGINVAGETTSTNVAGETFKLSSYLKYAVIDEDQSALNRDALVEKAGAGSALADYTSVDTPLLPDASKSVTVAIWMPTTVGNEANHKTGEAAPTIQLGVSLVATQYEHESDSFGKDYDKNADGTPDNEDAWASSSVTTGTVTAEGGTLTDNAAAPTVTVTVPANTVAADTELTLTKVKTETPSNITVAATDGATSFNVSLTDANGAAVAAPEGQTFTVELQVGKNLDITGFLHNDEPLPYSYDASTGILTFSTASFSPFTVTYKFNGGDGSEAAPYLIATGEQAVNMRNAKGYFKLVNDVVVSNEIYLSGKKITLDLNGHSITLQYAEGVKPNNGGVLNISGKNSNVTINDSSAAQTGAVIGSDRTFTNKVTSAVRVGNYGKLTINGGHFYGMSAETSCIFTMTSTASGSKATVVINGGIFETTPSNGTYFVLNHQDSFTTGCTMTVNGGKFRNYNPGVTVVDPVNAKTGKIVLGDGCTTTSETVGSDTWYTVSK